LDVASACEELGFYCLFCVSANKDSKIKEPALVGLKKGNARNIWNHRLKINYCVWYDSRAISFISNFSSEYFCETKKNKEGEYLYPECAKIYNKFMNFVDQFDSTFKSFWNNHRKRKWTHSLLYGLIKMTTVNAFVQFASITKSSMTYDDFLMTLLCSLINVSPIGNVKEGLRLKYTPGGSAQHAKKNVVLILVLFVEILYQEHASLSI